MSIAGALFFIPADALLVFACRKFQKELVGRNRSLRYFKAVRDMQSDDTHAQAEARVPSLRRALHAEFACHHTDTSERH